MTHSLVGDAEFQFVDRIKVQLLIVYYCKMMLFRCNPESTEIVGSRDGGEDHRCSREVFD